MLVNKGDDAAKTEEPVVLGNNDGLVFASKPVNSNPELTGDGATELEEATSVDVPLPNFKTDGAEVGNVAKIDGMLVPLVAEVLLEKTGSLEVTEVTFVEVEETEIAEDVGKQLLCNELVDVPKEKMLGIVDVDAPEEPVLSSDLYELPTSWVLSLLSEVIASGGVTGEVLEVPALLTNQKRKPRM